MGNKISFASQIIFGFLVTSLASVVVAQDEDVINQKLIYSTDVPEEPLYKHVTLTDDESELVYWVEEGDKSTFAKWKYYGPHWERYEEYNPENIIINEAISTPSGKNMIYSEKNRHSWGAGAAVYGSNLLIRNWESESIRELTLPTIDDSMVAIKSLSYVEDKVEITYLMGKPVTPVNFEQIVFQNFNTGEYRTINLIDQLNVNQYAWLTVREYDLSKDGKYLLYRVDRVYVGTDCCHSNIEYLVMMDTDTGELVKVIEDFGNGQFEGGFAVAGDGKSFVYQSRNELIKIKISSDESSTVLNIPDNPYGRPQPIKWLQLTYAGDGMAYMVDLDSSVGTYGSGLQFNNDSYYGLIGKERNPGMLLYKDLIEDKITIINKFNHYQLYPVQPVSLISNNEEILYLTTLDGGFSQYYNDKVHFVTHKISYDFKADDSLTGGWFNTENPGQGMFINMAPSPKFKEWNFDPQTDKSIPILTWYSVDNEGKPYWLIVTGEFQENRIVGTAYVTQGSQFGSAFNAEESESILWGQISVEFNDCTSALMTYDPVIEGFTAGSIELERLTVQSGLGCL